MEPSPTAIGISSPPRIRSTKSMPFLRFDRARDMRRTPSRASTLHGAIPEILLQANVSTSPERESNVGNGDPFSRPHEDEKGKDEMGEVAGLPLRLEDLPIEIRSLTERFLESLSAKVHPTPLGIDALSSMFQDFYTRAEAQIATHIAALSSRLSRDRSPPSSVSSRVSRAVHRKTSGNGTPRNPSPSDSTKGEQQMVSTSELLDKRKARRLLQVKRTALEEAVERAVCERLYDRLYRHRSTEDEERDQKLRSRVAAFSVVGIGLKELLVTGTYEDLAEEVQIQVSRDEEQIKAWLSNARASLQAMDAAPYPAAKLTHLTAAHKGIVETLGKMFPASSSADEILPTLIYTLLTTTPSEINVISNLTFIQRFRAASKVDGEAAYCLVNLEAAISFLETVDLPTLRKDERSEGPQKSSRPTTPRIVSTPMQLGITPAMELSISPRSDGAMSTNSQALPSPTKNPRRLSTLTQPFSTGAARIEAASDSFRNAVLDGADHTFEAINNTVENSFRFMFGRLKEQQSKSSMRSVSASSSLGRTSRTETNVKETLVEMPKTLEDARKIVSPSTASEDLFLPETYGSAMASPNAAANNSKHDAVNSTPSNRSDDGHVDVGSLANLPKSDDSSTRFVDLFGGRRQRRDRSVDSSLSGGSAAGKKVAFMDTGAREPLSPPPLEDGDGTGSVEEALGSTSKAAPAPPHSLTSPINASNAVDSLKGLGNSLNPFNRIASVGHGLFGRSSPGPSPLPSATFANLDAAASRPVPNDVGTVSVALTPREARALAGIAELKRIEGVRRFMEVKGAAELRVGEVETLLRAYQDLVGRVRSVVDS